MDYPDFVQSTGYGHVEGLCGVNCRHSWGTYFPGISAPPPSEEELAEQRKRDKATKSYTWKDRRGNEHTRDFTLRDAFDRQRELERSMRFTRKQAAAMKAAGQMPEYTALKAKIRTQRAEYQKFSAAMGIKPDWERVYMDGIKNL